jgi:hypothetical protein
MSCDEYCCNHGCTRAEGCPARQPAAVAKVGQRIPAAAPLPPRKRDHIKDLARAMLAVVLVMTGTVFLVQIFIH